MASHEKMLAGVVQKIIHGKAPAKAAPKAAFKGKGPLFAKRPVVDRKAEEKKEAPQAESAEHEIHIHIHR